MVEVRNKEGLLEQKFDKITYIISRFNLGDNIEEIEKCYSMLGRCIDEYKSLYQERRNFKYKYNIQRGEEWRDSKLNMWK